jgi:hypothetical protein
MPSTGNQHTGEDNMFFRSQDNGATWVSYGSDSGFTTDYPSAMTVFHPQNPNVIYSGSGLERRIISHDLGQAWQASSLGPNGHKPFFIHPLDPKIMIDVNRFSRDGGVTFSENSNSYFVRMPSNRFDILFRQKGTQLQICRMDDVGPEIQLMGYGDSRLVVDEPSELTIYAYVVDPSEHDRISHIELFWDGMPTGFKIYPNDKNNDDSSEFISFNVPFVPTTALFSRFNWIAMDIFGNKSSPWPTLNSK